MKKISWPTFLLTIGTYIFLLICFLYSAHKRGSDDLFIVVVIYVIVMNIVNYLHHSGVISSNIFLYRDISIAHWKDGSVKLPDVIVSVNGKKYKGHIDYAIDPDPATIPKDKI